MFAPGSGRYLAASAGGLVLLTAGVAAAWVPRTAFSGLLLLVGWGFFVFFAVFLRDPERLVGEGIVAAADGRIRAITTEGERIRISTFMNVTDVHVNRFPLDAVVASMSDEGSGFRPAFVDDARHNQRRHYQLATSLGPVEVVQMTGFLARRLVSLVGVGDRGPKGGRLGMILLGSRVDVLLPAARVTPSVAVGERVRAGVTTIAREHA
ncbi:MAG: phosphatidylserine decarboxylase [Thermoplasmata archaeon]|nr:phosphatidylserine decarboxylase [Thermoplasmata archaeon]